MRFRALLGNRPRKGTPDDGRDSGMALVYTMVFMMFLATVILTMLSQLTSEVRQTLFSRKHEQTLNSALAGVNAGLNRIRNATDTASGAGIVPFLPCDVGTNRARISGSTDASGAFTYTTDIYYLATDPSRMTDAGAAAAGLTCPLNSVPQFAYLISTGSQAALPGAGTAFGNRTVHAVYDFSTSNVKASGGTIMTANGLCWDAGPAPVVGSPIVLQACLPAGTPSQSWYFRPDLSILWTGDTSVNLCLDYRGVAALPYSSPMTLQTCIGPGTAGSAYDSINQTYPRAGQRYQEFSLGTWLKDVTAGGDAGAANCMVTFTPSTGLYEQRLVGDRMAMSPVCSSGAYAVFSKTTGAGGTGGVTNGLPSNSEQLVSYAYTSNCLDVFASTPSRGLINYPCHQAPDPGKVEGNQRFQYGGTTTTPGPMSTVRTDNPVFNYSTVCLDSNGSTVVLVACVAGKTSQQWLLTGFRPGDYAGSYLITDYTGKCLHAASGYGIQLRTCDGSDNQKWNAPPGGTQSTIADLGEK